MQISKAEALHYMKDSLQENKSFSLEQVFCQSWCKKDEEDIFNFMDQLIKDNKSLQAKLQQKEEETATKLTWFREAILWLSLRIAARELSSASRPFFNYFNQIGTFILGLLAVLSHSFPLLGNRR